MSLLFPDGIFSPQALGDERATGILLDATLRCGAVLRPSDILHAVIGSGDQAVLSVLGLALADGAQPRHLRETIEVYNAGAGESGASSRPFDGSRARCAPETLAALDAFEKALSADRERLRPVALELLLARLLEHQDADDLTFLGSVLDAPAAVLALDEQVRVSSEPLPALLDDASGRLRSEEFSADAWGVLELAAERAGELGYDRLLPAHCFLALLAGTEGLTERLVRLQIPPRIGLVKAVEVLNGAFRLSEHAKDAPPLHRDGLGDPLLALLHAARRAAALRGGERADTGHLLEALLADPPPRLAAVLEGEPLRLNVGRMRDHLDQELRSARTAAPREVPFRPAAGAPPSEDLTWLARTEGIPPVPHLDHYFDPVNRALHRTVGNHVLLTGESGVGATTLLRELARRAADGTIPFLRRKRFLHVDCQDVAPAESAEKLGRIISDVAGRTDLVVCLDGLGALLRGPNGTNHVLTLRSALKERRLHLVGVLSGQDYDDLLAADHALRELTTRVELAEPGRDAARDMVGQAADGLAAEFGIAVAGKAVDRAVVMAGDFILSQRLPLAAVKVLRRAAEDLHYRRTQLGDPRSEVGVADVVRVIAEVSGVPAAQISGTGGERVDYEQALGGSVFGQDRAVATVAGELRRIKAGLAGADGGPASVMLFAGLTGVGKTELAKTVASFYSTSKLLQTYPMGGFTERHSVSSILGSPQGYVGHERGGRIVNELNADPYGVFLLDEAEKAHAEVWRPFLNLFDEGWIEDRRGVRAHGDRAIFILTTNAGHDVIARMTRQGADEEAIAAAVKEALLRARSGGSHEDPVFTPEFLARIRRIIVFRPLDEDAMAGICRKMVDAKQAFWREKREKDLVVPERLIAWAARRAHEGNEAADGKEGARKLRELLTDLIEDPILKAQERLEDDYRRCARIELDFDPGPPPRTEVRFAAATDLAKNELAKNELAKSDPAKNGEVR
ncbi:AAA family ATPase [Streptomyces johnsoniae]|uniref:AAA family ATPase n=1 Tax=Streptomyces johnsoniae TaxID=3075532 RepID=A0ABU2SDP2_9ACTN|nr:AAA family ATPase [Streptomyces sp. DSM 41886]MDT0447085.1 AAA family ATPase [Streptomyces sp. DSM 41886]